jgi:hypothetical protein
MQHNSQTGNPTELLIELRRRVDQADCKVQLADSLAHLLAQLNAPDRLPGLLRIAENILAILEQGSGVPIPKNMNSRVAGWKDALTWITRNSDGIATETFVVPADKERFGRTTDGKPPSVSEMIDFANALQLLGADHVTAEQRDVLLPFLAKTEKDRRHLLLREGFQSLLVDGARYAQDLGSTGGTTL